MLSMTMIVMMTVKSARSEMKTGKMEAVFDTSNGIQIRE